MSTAHPEQVCARFIKAGNPTQSLATAKAWVRQCPADAQARIGLFQLLAVAGEWQRAQQQLRLAAELDQGWAHVVAAYARILDAELEREQVLAGRMMPLMPGQVPPWQHDLLQALHHDRDGEPGQATRWRALALAQADAIAGHIDGQRFDWLADADPRFGPCLEVILEAGYAWVPFAQLRSLRFEVPGSLREMPWQSVEIEWRDGTRSRGMVPCRYPGSQHSEDCAIRVGQRTVWEGEELSACGLGQRLLAGSEDDYPVRDIRHIAFDTAAVEAPWPN
ncbi:type VI secretion system accessory protein TagJ [Xanthomonas axonopodis pv. vasculorum]|uniref:ImpE protein n=1 Tax=Xanthomonas axonopodis pv. vasculorum TaxID=325777 RepID=A0A098PZC3_9XANT|nr:type VI secretion system accessory protein TagJ [Xanthomonas axonopodis]KGE52360.1 ImpE protein [Xanthomonas axonopodis pv. vasculorum]PPV09475.1 ImpE protein [Xanthomonas axonopodis pv. vasculorum]QKD86748.1 ImpE protein [Xanthomonas axonopodis pv. vasculorum]